MDIEGSEEWFGTEKETIDKREEQRLERAFPEGGGAVMAIVPEEVRKEDVTKLLEILVRSYSMKMQAKRTDEKEIPDFLWIIAEESKDAAYIEKELMKEKENLSDVKVHYYEGNEIFISGIQGKEVRKKCDYHMQALYGDGRGKNLNREWLSGSESERRKQKTSTIRI